MASMRDIQRRKGSITSISQITKAMKLVSTVKLQKTRRQAEESKPYFETMYEAMTSILSRSGVLEHKYTRPGETGKKAVIAISSNRGLAGGYHINLVRAVMESGLPKEDVLIYNIGRKGGEVLLRRGYQIEKDYSDVINAPLFSDAQEICSQVLEDFEQGKVSEIYLAYTAFKNTVVHTPTLRRLLPIEIGTELTEKKEEIDKTEQNTLMNYEPDEEAVLDVIIPKYVTSLIYGGITESAASENGARMQAMDSASKNAEEMMEKLQQQYNRARQGAITQELTEIIAGADEVD